MTSLMVLRYGLCVLIVTWMAGIAGASIRETPKNDTASCPLRCNLKNGFCQPNDKCSCFQGWEGVNCDQCIRSPGCMNGTCDKPGQCNCKEGYGGRHCQLDLQFCERSRPCRNAATCVNDGSGSYICHCPVGFTGRTCAFRKKSQSEFCLNGGTCIFGNDIVGCERCNCRNGYVGKRCETLLRMCVQRPCANGGRCVDLLNAFKCECTKGYYGKFCNQDVDECTLEGARACENGGTCFNRRGSFTCVCREGFEGVRCDKPIQRYTPPSTTLAITETKFTMKNNIANTIKKALLRRPGHPNVRAPKESTVQKHSSTNIRVTHFLEKVEVQSSHSAFINHVMNGNGLLKPEPVPSNVSVVQAVTFAFLGVAVALFIGIGLIVWIQLRKRGKCCFKVTSVSGNDVEEAVCLNQERNNIVKPSFTLNNVPKKKSNQPKPGLVVRTVTPSRGRLDCVENPHGGGLYVGLPWEVDRNMSPISSIDETNSLLESSKLNRSSNFYNNRH